jgi:hypothetical protein
MLRCPDDGPVEIRMLTYQDPSTGQRVRPGAKPGDAYQEADPPIAKRRLPQGNVRLPPVLNEVLRRA